MKLLLLTVVIDVEFFTKMTPSLRKEQRKKMHCFCMKSKNVFFFLWVVSLFQKGVTTEKKLT